MSAENKPEFPPLLPAGLHSMTMAALRQIAVCDFPLSKTRNGIMAGLEALATKLVLASIKGDLWIDGSFLTKKIDPEDVDLTLCLSGAFYDGCTAEQRAAVDWVNSGGGLKQTYFCHSFAWVSYPEGHEAYWESEWDRAYWIRQWGFSRGNERKGIVVVNVPDGIAARWPGGVV